MRGVFTANSHKAFACKNKPAVGLKELQNTRESLVAPEHPGRRQKERKEGIKTTQESGIQRPRKRTRTHEKA